MNLKEFILENLLDGEYVVVGFSSEEMEDEEYGISQYEAYEQAENIADMGGLNILGRMELSYVTISTEEIPKVVAALWISEGGDNFSFDLAVHPKYQNKGLSNKLIKMAISEYKYQKEAYGDDFKMEVDVVNPKLADILRTKYDFKIINNLGNGRVIMAMD